MARSKQTKPPEWIRIPKFCVNKGCNRRGITARKLSDFWVVLCAECERQNIAGKSITLDTTKIMAERPEGYTPGKAA